MAPVHDALGRAALPVIASERRQLCKCAVMGLDVTGLLFMLVPGTFSVYGNLIEISNRQTAAHLDPSWLQAHGHAQIVGWIRPSFLASASTRYRCER